MKILKVFAVSLAVSLACLAAEASDKVQGLDGVQIAARFPLIGQDRMQGFLRTKFTMDGCEAWVVEPETPAADGRWVWCMEWPTAFQDRTGVKALLSAGYRWVTFNPASKTNYAGNQNDEMIAKRRAFQKFPRRGLGIRLQLIALPHRIRIERAQTLQKAGAQRFPVHNLGLDGVGHRQKLAHRGVFELRP